MNHPLVHQILIVICCIFIFYLVGLSYWEPAFDKLTVDEVLSSDLNDPHDLSIGVVLVSHVKDETVGSVTDMNLEHFVPLRIEVVEYDSGLGNPSRKYSCG